MDKTNLEGMPLTQAVKTWMDDKGWAGPIDVNEDHTLSTVETTMTIQEQVYKVVIETLETEQAVFVYFYTAYLVPRHRIDAMARLLNRINFQMDLGRLACQDGPAARPIQYKVGVDVEGSTLSPVQIHTLVSQAVNAFRVYGNLLAAVALTKQSVDELWTEFTSGQEWNPAWADVKVPRLLN